VWVNGYEQTRNQSAEDVLEEFSVGSVIAMEVYRGGTEVPAEFMSMRYCGVISVWTR
jgi:alpha/beta superfamily hydrolase